MAAEADPEKGANHVDSSATLTSSQTQPHTGVLHHAGRKVRHFLLPSGRKVHVAHHPEEEQRLRRHLSVIQPQSDFDIVIHGSSDHIKALRESHGHHESIREELRVKYGPDFERFENIIKELDRLNTELHMVSEHAVQLDANFEKFGYSAHLRTLPNNSGNNSSASSVYDGDHDHDDDHTSNADHYKSTQAQGQSLIFIKRPMMRQYFHKGLLWRAQELQEVSSYELFVDLFYVGIIAIAGDAASETPTGESLLKFVIVFTLSWKFWSDVSVFVSWFDAEDIFRRIMILFILTCLLGFTVNINGSWENTWTALLSFYIAPRWLGSLYYLWMAYLIPMVRNAMIGSAIVAFVPGLLYIGSIYVGEWSRQALIWPALFLDIFGSIILVTVQRGPSWLGTKGSKWARKTFDFIPGANIEHKIERTNAFVALVFGYSVIALLYQSAVAFPLNAYFGKAVLFLIIAFTYNWIYFEIDTFNMHTHAIRRHFWSSLLWTTSHLPFVMAYVLAGAALSKIVLAHDTQAVNADMLLEPYSGRSEETFDPGLRWFYCAGLSIAMIMMGLISYSHTYKTIPNARLRKEYRLLYRFAVSIVMLLLPLAKESLNSLELVATTAGLVVSILVVELKGNASSGTAFFGLGEFRGRKCAYTAKCHVSRKELSDNVKSGKVVNVEEMAKKEKSRENAREGFSV